MSKAKAKAKAKKKSVKKKVAAKAKRPPKPAPKPYQHKKLERLTIKQLTALDPCWEGLEWFKKALDKSKSYGFTDAEVDKIFDRYIPAVSFDFRWLGWIFERLTVDRLIDAMNPNYDGFNREKKRIEKVARVFNNECSRAARDYSLGFTTMVKRVEAAKVMMKVFNRAYKEL